MSMLLHGDCLEELKGIDDDSVDLVFCDLPYGQTSCKWDCPIDLDKFWVEIMRVKKLHTPIFMTTTTKFGVSLINSAPKKCPFRYDLVWVKSSSAGFLCAKKMPMRKHEMVYVFYEKLPFYDLSSHKHKFVKETNEKYTYQQDKEKDLYGTDIRKEVRTGKSVGKSSVYDPPLPNSVVKEPAYYMKDGKTIYNGGKAMGVFNKGGTAYEPPLPVSVVKEEYNGLYGDLKAPEYVSDNEKRNKLRRENYAKGKSDSAYEPPLPDSMLEIKSTRGKHSTEKPVALMEWIFKYYSKEGDVILDPTMGSGSTGVAAKNMNRNFIGIEKDPEIYEVAVNRLEV